MRLARVFRRTKGEGGRWSAVSPRTSLGAPRHCARAVGSLTPMMRTTPQRYSTRQVTERLAHHIETYLGRAHQAPLTASVTAGEIRGYLRERYSFAAPLALEEVLDDTASMLWRWSEHASNPRHFGLFRPGVDLPAVVGETLVALHDPNLATWRFSPAAAEMEAHALAAIGERLGFPQGGEGSCFTSCGQEANHTAVAVALTHTFPDVARYGLRALVGQPVLYLSEEAHHSLDKAAHVTGLGRDAVRRVRVGDDLRMDVEALAASIARDRAAGELPFLVVATAGTTAAGVIDPLPEVAALAAAEGLWLHVDAAWGGAAALSDRLRLHLAGIESAASVTCDAHKLLSVPVGAGMFFCRRREAVEATFAARPPYVPPPPPGRPADPYQATLQWSRRCNGIKLFMMLATHGIEGIARRIEHQTAMGERLRFLLSKAGWRLVNHTPLPVVCFTHDALGGDEEAHRRIARTLGERQVAWISATRLRGRQVALRACITHFDTQPSDLAALVDGVQEAVA